MKKLYLPLIATGLCISASANAIVNMEALHTGKPKEGFSGNVELSLSRTTGNSETEDYNLGSRLQWHEGAMTDYLLLSGSYGKSGGVKSTDKSFVHLRHIQQFRPTTAWEAYLQAEKDQFARLEYRGLAGGGLRFKLYEQENKGAIYLGLGAYYSQERIDDAYADSGTESLWRGSSYLLLKYQASPNTVLMSTSYYQPAVGDTGDYRALEQGAMKVKINDMLSLVLSVDYSYDSEPPLGVEKANSTVKTSFSLDF